MKRGVRGAVTGRSWSAPQFHKFSSAMVQSQKVRHNSTNFRRKLSIFKEDVCRNFTNLRQNLLIFKKGMRGAASGRVGRVGRSPIRFFDLILNHALALRASYNLRKNADITHRELIREKAHDACKGASARVLIRKISE